MKIGTTICFLLFGFPAIGFGQLTGIKIGVDPGHGGNSGLNPIGAQGPTGLLEKNVNLATALKLQAYLIADGATVIMTRTTDTPIDLQARTNYLITNHVDRVVSVHHNGGAPTTNTTMTFAYCGLCNEPAGVLGAAVVNRLGDSTLLPLGPAASTEDARCPSPNATFPCQVPGLGQADLWMVHVPWTQAQIPAILTEASFITNPSEEARLYNPAYLDANAWAIYAGIADYYGVQPTPPPSTGSITIYATLDGQPWSGPVSYSVSGSATNFTGTSTGIQSNLLAGGYTVQYLSGGPGDFVEIVPASSQQLFAGGNISWTLKFTAMCTATSGGATATSPCPPTPTLTATLSASPASGTAPLNDVDLTASAGGTATGTINYSFYCNRGDSGTNITPPNPDFKQDGISTNPKTVTDLCDYTQPGTYTAKVIVERGSLAAEARRTITVGGSSSPVPVVTTLAATSVTQASATLNATVDPKNSTTTFWFDYGTTTSVNQVTNAQTLAAATSASAVSISQGGLSCGQQYSYRIRASNSGGAAAPGSILSFITDSCGGGGPQSVQLVADPSFEAGNNAWWVANPAFYINGTPTFPNPRTGSKYAFLSNPDGSRGNNLSGGMISPPVTIPADATDADLRLYYSITSDETTSTQVYDKVDVYLVRPGNQLNLITTISNLDENGTSYSLESTDLSSSFYGDTVQIFFAGSTNGSNPTVFRIDDVTLDVDLPSASAPEVTTDSADQVNASSARLNMTVNPHGANTEVWFDLEAGDSTPNDDTQHISIGAGSQNESVSIAVFGLQCGTLYYFQAEASNSEGSDSGIVRSFTTSPCAGSAPHADTDPAENITQTSATLTADVDPNGLSTQAWFAWGTTTNLGQETSHVSVGAGTGNVDFSQTLSGLSCGTTYFFENRAANSAGQDDGVTLEFTTTACGPPPGYPINVTTGTAGSITETSAVLNGSANPNGASTNGFFAYGIWPNLDYTFTVPIGSGRTDQPFSILLTGLSCGSEYLFDAMANNEFGESNGGGKLFRTLDCGTSPGYPINVTTGTAGSITKTSAVLNGSANPNGASTTGFFILYPPYPAQGFTSGSVSLGASTTDQPFTVTVTDLNCGTKYQYLADATNSFGESNGAARTFDTLACSAGATPSCGRTLLQQPRGGFGGCDESQDSGGGTVAENFRVTTVDHIDCIELLGYYWPGNDPPPLSTFRVALYRVTAQGYPGEKFFEGSGIPGFREMTGEVLGGLNEWRFQLGLVYPARLAPGDYFIEVAGTATSGGGFCWTGGAQDPVSGLPGIAYKNTGAPWALGGWNDAITLWGRTIARDGFESGDLSGWSTTE